MDGMGYKKIDSPTILLESRGVATFNPFQDATFVACGSKGGGWWENMTQNRKETTIFWPVYIDVFFF